MKRIALLIATLALAAGSLIGLNPSPADAHPIPSGTPTPYAYCQWRLYETGFNQNYFLHDSTWFHYGDVHVYRCWYRSGYSSGGQRSNLCMQVLEWYGFYGEDWFNGSPLWTSEPPWAGTPCW